MTRMYLSPTATLFAKIGLIVVECLIGLYNLITYPIRKISLKAYILFVIAAGGFYAAGDRFGLEISLVTMIIAVVMFTVAIVVSKLIYHYLNKKVSPKVALLINSPLGIPLNRFYHSAC